MKSQKSIQPPPTQAVSATKPSNTSKSSVVEVPKPTTSNAKPAFDPFASEIAPVEDFNYGNRKFYFS